MKRLYWILCLLVALVICTVPAAAVLQETSLTGVVEDVSPVEDRINFSAYTTIGLDYGVGTGTPEIVYTTIDPPAMLQFVPPNPAVYDLVKNGETAAVTILGGLDGNCIAVARIQETTDGEVVITDLAGDPNTLPYKLAGNYSLTYEAEPDCEQADGTNAPALSVNVTLYSEGREVYTEHLLPGEYFTWNGRNDGSAIKVSFIAGQASASTCSGSVMMAGPQPISTFVIEVTPPIGLDLMEATLIESAPTATTALMTVPSPSTTSAQPTPGFLSVTVIAGLLGAMLILRRT